MDIFIKTSQFLLSLSFLIILHELGHFIPAKLFKTKVEKFYLFFDPWFSLIKKKIGETEYGIGWLPLGGYVKISGMIDESMDKEAMKQPAQPWEFRSKPAWQRLIIMLGGVTVNLFLGIIIYGMMLFTWGEEYLPNDNVKYGVWADSIAQTIGFENGDNVVSLDDKSINKFSEITGRVLLEDVKTIQIERGGESVELQVTDAFVKAVIDNRGRPFLTPRFPFVAGKIVKDSYAEEIGIQKEDEFIGLDGEKIIYFDRFTETLQAKKGQRAKLKILRGGEEQEIDIVIPESGKLGIYPVEPNYFFDLETIQYGFWESIPAGAKKAFKVLNDYINQFKLVLSPKTGAYKSLGGFISIGNLFPPVWDWQTFWSMTALLSIILAFMNVLPIPALDGGHVLFLLYEIITGRKPHDKFMEYAQMVGMIILFALLIFVNGNDIFKLF